MKNRNFKKNKSKNLTNLGLIKTFANRHSQRDYEIKIVAPEFTAVCPRTGQPDFATLTLTYTPDQLCLELKSLKLYLQSFRHRGIFHEDVTNTILNDLVKSCAPRQMTLVGDFNTRGGIRTTVTVTYCMRSVTNCQQSVKKHSVKS